MVRYAYLVIITKSEQADRVVIFSNSTAQSRGKMVIIL